MRFSIIVPIYNVEAYLEECIESILGQSYENFELILIVDGSPDRSLEICRRYEAHDSRVTVVYQENRGLIATRKAGASIAKGDYIISVDGDDYIHKDLLLSISNAIDENPNTDMICYGYYKTDGNSILGTVFNMLPPGAYDNIGWLRNQYLFSSALSRDNSGVLVYSVWVKAIKRDIYYTAQNLVPDYVRNGEDILLTAHVLCRVKTLTVIKFAGYYYRMNQGSMTHNRKYTDISNIEIVKNELEKTHMFPNENIGRYYVNSLYVIMHDIIKTSSLKDWKNNIDKLHIEKNINRFDIHQLSFSIRMKNYLISHQKWNTIYLWVKIAG